MPSHAEQQALPYTPEQMFRLAADIERYPEFLPWCRAARILERKEGECLAELVISFRHMTERYTSRVVFTPHSAIDVTMVEGPFHHLVNRWRFAPDGQGTRVDFFLDFQFRSRLLEVMAGHMFEKATSHMIDAFRRRAAALYGERK